MAPNDCPSCGGVGWYLEAVPLNHPQFGKLLPCACMQAERQARQAAAEADARMRRLTGLASELGQMATVTLQSFAIDRKITSAVEWNKQRYTPTEQRKLLHLGYRTVAAYSQNPSGWLYLMGTYGSGKTLLAAGCANALTERYHVTYASAPRLLKYIRAGFDDHSADARMEAIETTPILIIDDIGSEQLTSWSESLLFDLLNQRYHYGRATVLTSNLHHDQLPPRIASRIVERCETTGIVALPIEDYRRIQRPMSTTRPVVPIGTGDVWEKAG